jgi:hypothetical protein
LFLLLVVFIRTSPFCVAVWNLIGGVRIPGEDEKDSGVNAKRVPGRTRFRAEGEQ